MMVEITDEMVEMAAKAIYDAVPFFIAQSNRTEMARAALEAVAPLIARAENEACAEIVSGFNGNWLDGTDEIEAAIRARHATTPPSSGSQQQEQSDPGPQTK